MDTATLLGIAGLIATILFGVIGALVIRNRLSQRQKAAPHSTAIQSGRDSNVRNQGSTVENATGNIIVMPNGNITFTNATPDVNIDELRNIATLLKTWKLENAPPVSGNPCKNTAAAPQTALRFVPIPFPQSFWHIGRRGTEPSMQIATDWHVTNISDVPVRLLSARLLQPLLNDPDGFSVIFSAESRGGLHRSNVPIPPGETWHTAIQFYTGPPVQAEATPLEVEFIVIDQFAHEHRVKITLRYF